MSIFAIIENEKVANVVIADDLTVMQMLLPDAVLVESTEETGQAAVGADYRSDVNKFVPLKSYDSWTWDEESWSWKAPKPYPKTVSEGSIAVWNEESLSWVEFTPQITEEPAE